MDKKSILVVEDEQSTATLLDTILKKHGYNVVLAHHGKMALSLIGAMRPDLIISDVIMPEMNGYEFFKQVRENAATAHIPFIVLTAHVKIGNTFYDLAVDAVMFKPVIATELLDKVDHLLTLGRQAEAAVSTAEIFRKHRGLIVMVSLLAVIFLAGLGFFLRFITPRWADKKMGEPVYIMKRKDLSDSFK